MHWPICIFIYYYWLYRYLHEAQQNIIRNILKSTTPTTTIHIVCIWVRIAKIFQVDNHHVLKIRFEVSSNYSHGQLWFVWRKTLHVTAYRQVHHAREYHSYTKLIYVQLVAIRTERKVTNFIAYNRFKRVDRNRRTSNRSHVTIIIAHAPRSVNAAPYRANNKICVRVCSCTAVSYMSHRSHGSIRETRRWSDKPHALLHEDTATDLKWVSNEIHSQTCTDAVIIAERSTLCTQPLWGVGQREAQRIETNCKKRINIEFNSVEQLRWVLRGVLRAYWCIARTRGHITNSTVKKKKPHRSTNFLS